MPDRKTNSRAIRTVFWREIAAFSVSALLLWLVLLLFYWQSTTEERRLRGEQSRYQLQLARQIVDRDLKRVHADLFFLARLETTLAGDLRQDDLRGLADAFVTFGEAQRCYQQIRVIRRDGRERLRVNWDGTQASIVAEEDLQNKSQRPYVREALALACGEIYTSEFDLNQEHGEIEQPLKPVIRFVTPLCAASGEPGDLLVLNYDGSALLEEIARIQLPGGIFLVRDEGGFLLGPERSVEWAWLLGRDDSLHSVYPGLKPLAEQPQQAGLIWTDEGSFLFADVSLHHGVRPDREQSPELWFVSHIPRSEATAESRQTLRQLLILGVLGMIPLALLSYLWAVAAQRRAESEQLLREEKERLARSNEDLETFAYVASHDLRAPLRGVENLANWLSEDLAGSLPEASQTHLEQLRQRVQRMDTLIEDLVNYLRVGKQPRASVEIPLRALIDDAAGLVGLPDKFSLEVVIEVEELHGHLVPLETVLCNLLSNAAKHHDQSKGTIRVEARAVDDEVEFAVTDDGPGIDAKHRKLAVAMFHTLRPRDEVEGSGMGLAIVKRIVELEGGSMQLESAQPRGLTVRFTWPRRIDE